MTALFFHVKAALACGLLMRPLFLLALAGFMRGRTPAPAALRSRPTAPALGARKIEACIESYQPIMWVHAGPMGPHLGLRGANLLINFPLGVITRARAILTAESLSSTTQSA